MVKDVTFKDVIKSALMSVYMSRQVAIIDNDCTEEEADKIIADCARECLDYYKDMDREDLAIEMINQLLHMTKEKEERDS